MVDPAVVEERVLRSRACVVKSGLQGSIRSTSKVLRARASVPRVSVLRVSASLEIFRFRASKLELSVFVRPRSRTRSLTRGRGRTSNSGSPTLIIKPHKLCSDCSAPQASIPGILRRIQAQQRYPSSAYPIFQVSNRPTGSQSLSSESYSSKPQSCTSRTRNRNSKPKRRKGNRQQAERCCRVLVGELLNALARGPCGGGGWWWWFG